ncbi:uncharacterized protein LOC119907525 isoform X2 [Micropterus salmoides]|uniref:uncharacterized protein LOC119907525 isoform X1 n=1 Tax=Micropterus salmoides TaxID=27706 RepID=UPI0018EC0079|nr:uncharacterized protein LOC119907525 isoform X1 [Micropterus salmoides]XP_038581217.1 uncharacterized protein LOC119907525 isoform X2 [Micropterus salmoides]
MSKVQMLRGFINQRLTAAAEEIFGLFERTISEYEEELCRSKEENQRHRKLLDAVFQPEVRLHRAAVQQLLVSKEEVPPEQQQQWSPRLDQEDPPEPPHIKEEQEELWTSQEGEQLPELEEAEITEFLFRASSQALNGRADTDFNCVPNEQTMAFSCLETQQTDGHASCLTPPCAPSDYPGLSLTQTQNSWTSRVEIPWDKMPASLSKAVIGGQRASPADRRAMVRAVVGVMQEHCPNPNRAACVEIAKTIVSRYPLTFADTTGEGEQLGVGYYSLVNQLKTRVEHVNRNNLSHRIRRPRTTTQSSAATKTVRCKVDSYGCINWQPKSLPEGETFKSLEDRRKTLTAIFRAAGPRAADTPDIDDSMSLTYIYQRHTINSCPPPSVSVIEEQWPFLFTKRGLCAHFKTLTGIDICDRVAEALQSKGKRIIYFFQRQSESGDVQSESGDVQSESGDVQSESGDVQSESGDTTTMQPNRTGIAAVLLLMKHFHEKEDSIFILVDPTATKASIEKDTTLPATPRLILLGKTFLSATKWMVSIEGKVAFVLEEHLGFADALSVFFGCFYVFNIEYQEPACATLELIQRYFVRLNPENGTKCTAKTGVSRKTGEIVKRKMAVVNNRVSSFIRQLTELE